MSDVVGAMTERLLIDAGVGAGMRVLDVGCGRGDVAFLAARLVGADGRVLGVDRDAGALTLARVRAAELGLAHVEFAEADLGALGPEHGTFDAAVGRRVLMYQPDAVSAVRRLARAVRPGGRVIFQEHDGSMGPGRRAPLPLHERVSAWIWRTVEREGANVHMGFDLAAVLAEAGLAVEHVRAEAIVQTPTAPYPVAAIARAVLPRIVRHGVATADEVDIETLEARLAEERERTNATYVSELVFGAWARRP